MFLRSFLPHLITVFALAAVFQGCNSESIPNTVSEDQISFIPQPSQVNFSGKHFLIDETALIHATLELRSEAEFLQEKIEDILGVELPIRYEPSDNILGRSITMVLDTSNITITNKEWYMLGVQKNFTVLSATDRAGIFRGIQTLLQMLPNEKGAVSIPGVLVRDSPRFPHRGLLLDCCRHFWSVEVIKKYIDLLAYYKMNVLHWHLTEDQGWRIEIKKYPKLTEVGAWRTEADGSRYGGYYTQEQIKEVVAYANSRHITIVPEIEMPGHSLAALSAYPHLACTDGPFEVTPEWGVFKDVYCAGNDSTFMFLEDVLTEVMALFPSQYIHIGGDESPKFRWENCDKCQKRMANEGLDDEHGLQSYFIRRIEKFLNENDRKLIGWDEILEGGLAPGATVQSWRGMQGGIDAAKSGNFAIMSPTSHCYLDYGLNSTDLEKIYSFNPIPDGLDSVERTRIIGGECNMWTEHVPTEIDLDSKVFPRMIGLAEVLWSYPQERNYSEFASRLKTHYPRLESWGVDYGFEKVPIGFSTEVNGNGVKVSVQKAMPELRAIVNYSASEKAVVWASDSTFTTFQELRFKAFLNGREYRNEFLLKVAPHIALGMETDCNVAFNDHYSAGGDIALTDGLLGTLYFRDGRWQGYSGTDLEVVMDLKELKTISSFSANFHQYNNAWIFAPEKVEYFISSDGIEFTSVGATHPTITPKEKGKFIETLSVNFDKTQARYVKMKVNSIGPCPSWHDAAGSPSWLFVDEFLVR